MLFKSYLFWAFFLLFATLYWAFGRRQKNILLLIASYCFYGTWDWRFLFLLAFTTTFEYCCSLAMYRCESPEIKRRILLSFLSVNIGLLGLFKYNKFFVTEFFELWSILGVPAHAPRATARRWVTVQWLRTRVLRQPRKLRGVGIPVLQAKECGRDQIVFGKNLQSFWKNDRP